MLNIAHIYWAKNGNWGDIALGRATQELFRHNIPNVTFATLPVSFLNKCWSDKTAYAEYDFAQAIDYINQCDCLLIGGGGMMLWFLVFAKRTNQLKDIKVPIIVYGIGLNIFYRPGEDTQYMRQPSHYIQKLIDRCDFFSVRNDGTAKIIQDEHNITIPESPPPCLWIKDYYTIDQQHVGSIAKRDKPYIIIAPAMDLKSVRGTYGNIQTTQLLKKYGAIARQLSKHYTVIAACHRVHDSGQLLDTESYIDVTLATRQRSVSRAYKLNTGLALYQNALAVVAMRGHSQIIPTSYGVPFVSFATQDKITQFAHQVGMGRYCYSCGVPGLPAKIVDDILTFRHNRRALTLHLQNYKKSQHPIMQNDFQQILKVLS